MEKNKNNKKPFIAFLLSFVLGITPITASGYSKDLQNDLQSQAKTEKSVETQNKIPTELDFKEKEIQDIADFTIAIVSANTQTRDAIIEATTQQLSELKSTLETTNEQQVDLVDKELATMNAVTNLTDPKALKKPGVETIYANMKLRKLYSEIVTEKMFDDDTTKAFDELTKTAGDITGIDYRTDDEEVQDIRAFIQLIEEKDAYSMDVKEIDRIIKETEQQAKLLKKAKKKATKKAKEDPYIDAEAISRQEEVVRIECKALQAAKDEVLPIPLQNPGIIGRFKKFFINIGKSLSNTASNAVLEDTVQYVNTSPAFDEATKNEMMNLIYTVEDLTGKDFTPTSKEIEQEETISINPGESNEQYTERVAEKALEREEQKNKGSKNNAREAFKKGIHKLR